VVIVVMLVPSLLLVIRFMFMIVLMMILGDQNGSIREQHGERQSRAHPSTNQNRLT
jgi:hypothetical protein